MPRFLRAAAGVATGVIILAGGVAHAADLSDTRIAFRTDRDGNPEIYVMRPDGLDPENITQSPADDRDPVWAPDGAILAFATDRDGHLEVYSTAPTAGATPANVTGRPGHDHRPTWSPVGDMIAFTAEGDGNREIYVMNADGTDQTNITRTGALDQSPAWSPDGSRIAFMSGRSGEQAIHTMNPDGTDVRKLTVGQREVGGPAWSPDGARIAYFSRVTGFFEIFAMDRDGTNQTQLTFDGANVRRPSWSPDGSRIAFPSTRDDRANWDIYTMDVDGANVARITTHPAQEMDPSWSPYLAPDGPTEVAVDVKPGSSRNPINLRSRGVTPIAILSTQTVAGDATDFDAATVDAATVQVGPLGAIPRRATLEDVDGDGDWDLLLHVDTRAMGIGHADGLLCLTASTMDDGAIEGCDAISIVPGRRRAAPASRAFAVGSNFPNPFNPETWVPFTLAEAADVTVRIYDAGGSVVRTLALGQRTAGEYVSRSTAAYWDGRTDDGEAAPSGLYLVQLTAGSQSAVRRMVIAR
jgi:dipeptidyl aminopeptidase/acylaminoacyl peptidase